MRSEIAQNFKFFGVPGSAPGPCWEAYSAPQTLSWWGGPQEPHPALGPSNLGLRPSGRSFVPPCDLHPRVNSIFALHCTYNVDCSVLPVAGVVDCIVVAALRRRRCRTVTCHNGGRCINIGRFSFRCICRPGYWGTRCQFSKSQPFVSVVDSCTKIC